MTRLERALERERIEDTRAHVEFCLDVLINERGACYKEICNLTGLCMTTVRRLASGEVTDWVRHGTVLKLSRAAGVKIVYRRARAAHDDTQH